ncbi:MAG: fibronectin type III domain-containing protein [Clostridia bacterium]|nr:fibronectin type III domain-containing protein [Clostridia bacterium]MBR2799253.1 fibronectin type III domain-containing protein [Clostridia bacterium]
MKSSFSGANSVTLKKTGTTRTTVKGLASGRRYYFRVRAFKAVNGRTCYGAWSKAKSVVAK